MLCEPYCGATLALPPPKSSGDQNTPQPKARGNQNIPQP